MDAVAVLTWAIVVFLVAATAATVWIMSDLHRLHRRVESELATMKAERAAQWEELTRDITNAKEGRR